MFRPNVKGYLVFNRIAFASSVLSLFILLILLRPSQAQTIPSLAGEGLQEFHRIATGEWRVEKRAIIQHEDKGTTLLLRGERDWNDYTVSVRVRIPRVAQQAEAGLLLHFTDMDNYLVYSLKNKKGGPFAVLRIARKKGQMSITADEAQLDLKLEDWHELKADVHGVDIYCYLDGKPLVAYSFQGTPPVYNAHGKTWDPDPDHGWTGLVTVDTPAEFEHFQVRPLTEFTHIVTPQRGRWDADGKLLPRQSYSETMQRFTDWIYHSGEVVDTEKAPVSLRDEAPYVLANFSTTDDQLLEVGGEFAFNHALLISGAVQYYTYSGERKYLDIAKITADFEIAHSTPTDWTLPYLPPSFLDFQPDGSWKGQDWGFEPDKSAYMGFSYLKLYSVTGNSKYLDAALRIAKTLEKLRQPDGSWPFRVNARTGKTKYAYTCSQLWYVWFFEKLTEATGNKSYLQYRDGALNWLLKNPVQDNKWVGLYGDKPSGAKSYDQWVALEMAMYLIDHRAANPGFLDKAREILDWINGVLVVDYDCFPGIPGLIEQSSYKVVLTHHELRLAELYAKLWEATAEPKYKDMAVQIANSVTWNIMSDGKMRQGFWYHAWGIPLGLSFDDQFTRIMACIPQTAPEGESHLLQSTSFVKDVAYGENEVRYRTVGRSYDVIIVARPPKAVKVGGRPLPSVQNPSADLVGWSYNRGTGLLRVSHEAADVSVELE